MKNPCLASILLLLLFPLICAAQESAPATQLKDSSNYYHLVDRYPAQQLGPKLQGYFDQQGQHTIDDILESGPEQFFGPTALLPKQVTPAESVWLRVQLQPEIDLQDWWLILKRDTTELEYVVGYGLVDVYFVQNGRIIRHARTGIYVPASQKEIREANTICRVLTDFRAGEPTDVYLQIRENGLVFPELEIRDPTFALPSPMNDVYQGVQWMSHIALAIGVYVLCFFFYTRDISYLYLFGMLTCMFLHYYILNPYMPLIDWFFPEHPKLINPAWSTLTVGSIFFLLEFGRSFTNLKTISPPMNKLMQWAMWLLVVLLAFRIGSWWLAPDKATLWDELSAGIIFLVQLGVMIRLAFIKDILMRHFVFGGLWLIFFSLLGILHNNDLIPFLEFPNPWMIAQLGFMLVYALALAQKLNISERAKFEVEKVKAVDAIKSRFFANISHEFRTPLSLILGPVNQALESIPASETIEDETEIAVRGKYLKVVKRNALRLQNLVDQILDLSKLDQGKMQLQAAEGDVIKFMRAIVFSFESLAEHNHIHFHTHFPQAIPTAYFDRDKLEKILVNLLSNAFKFTPEHGEVSVSVENTRKTLKILVSDTGSGMEASETSHIFDRFYQVEGTRDQGTGIGLSLVKELVDLHRGQISVDSIEGKGTTFKVILPYLRSDFSEQEIAAQATDKLREINRELVLNGSTENLVPDQHNGAKPEAPLLLIVEDNPDLRNYIAEQLGQQFRILSAVDGRQGYQMAEEQVPDLIVSDVMMPHMNGLELCSAVRTNVKTSHIPLILLTAKSGQDAKIEGLQAGADAYLTKPFDGRELQLRVCKLIEQRVLLREKFAGELKLRPSKVSLESMDEQFIRRVMQEIEKNMDNEFYSVEDLASAVGFSRSQLHRKLKGLADTSPNQLIRQFRLERARELLEQKVGSVSEVAYQVGYSNLSYFSKSYKETFGVLPSEV